MSALADAWREAGAASVVSASLPVELRAWLAGWASGVERLLPSPPPRTIARPGSWSTGDPSDTAARAIDPEETLRQIRAWESWYETAPGPARPPLSVLRGEPSTGRADSWDVLLQRVSLTPTATEAPYLTATRARWTDAAARARSAPFLARGRLTDAARDGEAAERRFWTRELDSRESRPPAPPTGAPPPPPTSDRPRRNNALRAAAMALGGFLAAMALGRKRGRR